MPRYRWVPPPGWPTPPPGWLPPPGWQPDPSWPAPPPYHVYWQRESWSLRRILAVAAAITLGVVAALGGCAAIVTSADGCGFDPPPGDYGQVTVVNDGDQPVDLFDCSDASCTSGINRQAVRPGDSPSSTYELCSGTSIGLTDSQGVLVGCVTLPIGESVQEHTYRASQFDRSCAGAGNVHPRIK